MTQAVSSNLSQIPCLNIYEPNRSGRDQGSPFFDTKTKTVLVASAILGTAGLVLLAFAPPIGAACIATGLLGISLVCLFKIVEGIHGLWTLSSLGSELEKLEKLPAAKQLASDITISPAIERELEEIIPKIDRKESDDRIASIQRTGNTAVFTLKSSPDLQFKLPCGESGFERFSEECKLARHYENMVYAKMICDSEKYDALVVPSIRPIHLSGSASGRYLLVEQKVERSESSASNLEQATRQMVRFLVKTGGNCDNVNPIPFTPIQGNKLSMQNIYHLTGDSHPNLSTREYGEVDFVIGRNHSLLASLDREDLIDIALDELKKLRPQNLTIAEGRRHPERAVQHRLQEIQEAKERRMAEIHPRG